MTDRDDITAEDVLSDAELRQHYRTHRHRGANCSDGACGGCPACLDAQGVVEDEEA